MCNCLMSFAYGNLCMQRPSCHGCSVKNKIDDTMKMTNLHAMLYYLRPQPHK